MAGSVRVDYCRMLQDRSDLVNRVIAHVSYLDVLLSFALYARSLALVCRPKLDASETPHIRLKSAMHPFTRPSSGDFIPNDVELGGSHAPLLLLTGPNMGGKSTLLRLVCLCTLMAQIGSFVPAMECVLTPVDQVSIHSLNAPAEQL